MTARPLAFDDRAVGQAADAVPRAPKVRIDDLAMFGGPRSFAAPKHVGTPNLGDRSALLARINDILDRRWLTNDGVYVRELEDRITKLLQVEHCIATCNGTAALEVLARAANLSGEVVLPSFTFVATAHALTWLGLEPVFCDIDAQRHSLDPDRVSELITERTCAIVGTHVWGAACDVARLERIASDNRLPLFFDAAHAFVCTHQGRMIGGFGRAEIFSFHATKFINSFEGGAITTNDAELARRARLMRNFGFAGFDNVVSLGINAKMNEVEAAMALTCLDSLDDILEINRHNYALYRGLLGRNRLFRVYEYPPLERCNYQYVVLEMRDDAPISRDLLVALLHAENVVARRYFFPGCHRMEPYRTRLADKEPRLPVTESVASRVLTLPTGTATSEEDVRQICGLLEFVSDHAERIVEHRAANSP